MASILSLQTLTMFMQTAMATIIIFVLVSVVRTELAHHGLVALMTGTWRPLTHSANEDLVDGVLAGVKDDNRNTIIIKARVMPKKGRNFVYFTATKDGWEETRRS